MHKTVLITGASKGIGLALAKVFLTNGYQVIGTSRSGNITALQDPACRVLPLDLTDGDSIAALGKYVQQEVSPIDVLINNAGIGPDLGDELPEINSLRQTLEVNLIGTMLLTELVCPYIHKHGKIINISSKMGSIGQCVQTDSVAYRISKTALNMYTKLLANRLMGKQTVAAVHPGWVRTTISKNGLNGRLSPEESAQKIVDFVCGDFETGIFWNVETQTVSTW